MTTTDRVVDLVSEGYDLAIRIAREPSLHHVARELAPVRRVVCATPGYFERFGIPASPEDLTKHNCLHYTHFGSQGEWRLQGDSGEIVVPVTGSFRVNDDDVLSRAVMGGLGVALLPTFIIGHELQAGRLQSVLVELCAAGAAHLRGPSPEPSPACESSWVHRLSAGQIRTCSLLGSSRRFRVAVGVGVLMK